MTNKMKQLTFALLAVCFFSCTPEEELKQEIALKKSLNISTILLDDTITFDKEDKMGVSVHELNGSYYKEMDRNIVAMRSGSEWNIGTKAKLTGEPAQVYAYFPYIEKADIKAVPIYASGTNTVLFGTHIKKEPEQEVSNANNNVELGLKTALSTVAINFTKKHYYGAARLEKIEILNAEGRTVLANHATLNVITGEVTPLPHDTAKVIKDCKWTTFTHEVHNIWEGLMRTPLIRSITEVLEEKNTQYLKVIPLSVSAGDLIFKFTIDGVVYTSAVPAGEWEQGKTLRYNFLLEGEEITDERIEEIFNIKFAQPSDSNHNYEFYPFNEEATRPIIHALKIWAQCLEITVPINALLGFANTYGAVALSSCSDDYIGDDRNYRYGMIQTNEILGYDARPNKNEMTIEYNTLGWWYYGLDLQFLTKPISDTGYTYATDLLYVSLHEMCHAFGFHSSLFSHEGIGTKSVPKPIEMNIFDTFMVDANGKSLIEYENGSKELSDVLATKNQVFFAGKNAVRANGGKPVLMNPDDVMFNKSHLTGFNIMSQGSFHHPGEIVLAMLKDIGWKIKPMPKMKLIEN